MLKNFASRARRLWKRPPAAAVSQRAAAASSPVQPPSSPATSTDDKPNDVDVLASLLSSPPPAAGSSPLPELAAATYSNQLIKQQIEEERRLQQELDAKLQALEQKRNDVDANMKRWDEMIQKKAAAVLSKKRPHSPFAAPSSQSEQSNEPLIDLPPLQPSSTASQHTTTLPHTTLPSAAADAHPKH